MGPLPSDPVFIGGWPYSTDALEVWPAAAGDDDEGAAAGDDDEGGVAAAGLESSRLSESSPTLVVEGAWVRGPAGGVAPTVGPLLAAAGVAATPSSFPMVVGEPILPL